MWDKNTITFISVKEEKYISNEKGGKFFHCSIIESPNSLFPHLKIKYHIYIYIVKTKKKSSF